MSSTPTKRPASDMVVGVIVVAVLIALVTLIVVSGAGAKLFPPSPATVQGKDISSLYDIVFAIAAVIFFLVEGLIVWTVLRYRRRPGDNELPPQIHGNNVAEIAWTVIPTIIVLALFVISLGTLNRVDAVSASPDIHIRAVGAQFQWEFDYLDKDGKTKLFTQFVPTAAGGGGMVVPVGENIEVQLNSKDVIHAFYVPRFLFKRDVVPGQTNVFDFTVDPSEAGSTFRGQCAELCGIGHQIMLFDVVAKTPAEYTSWLNDQIAKANATPAPAASGAPTGEILKLTAKNVAFDTHDLTATANQPFTIDFTNADTGIPHDVQIKDASGAIVYKGQQLNAAGQVQDAVPALAAGTYTFYCSIHPIPAMTGTLTVH